MAKFFKKQRTLRSAVFLIVSSFVVQMLLLLTNSWMDDIQSAVIAANYIKSSLAPHSPIIVPFALGPSADLNEAREIASNPGVVQLIDDTQLSNLAPTILKHIVPSAVCPSVSE